MIKKTLNICFISFIFIIFSCEKKNKITNQLIPKHHKVKEFIIKEEPLDLTIKTFGTLSFYEKVAISAQIQGRVKKLYKKVGDKVQKGDLLANLQKVQLEIEVKKAKADMIRARASLSLSKAKYQMARRQIEINLLNIEKLKENTQAVLLQLNNKKRLYKNNQLLLEKGAITQEKFETIKNGLAQSKITYSKSQKDLLMSLKGYSDKDIIFEGFQVPKSPKKRLEILKIINTKIEKAELNSAQANLDATKLRLESAEILLKESQIFSPQSGVIASRNIEVGEEIKKENPLYIILTTKNIYINLSISEKDINKIKLGQKVTYKLDAFPGKTFSGKISIISPMADVSTRSIECRVLAKNISGKQRPGMFADCEIKVSKKAKAILIPTSAFGQDEKDYYVYLIKKDRVYKKQILIGQEFNKRTEVLSGLKAGDMIVLDGLDFLQDKMKVLHQKSELEIQ